MQQNTGKRTDVYRSDPGAEFNQIFWALGRSETLNTEYLKPQRCQEKIEDNFTDLQKFTPPDEC